MTNTSNQIVTPPGRLVQGNLYELKNTDAQGRPLTIKNGPNAGQVREDCFFAVAVPKTAGIDWKQEAWAQPMVQAAQEGFPQGQWQAPTFAFKVVDGDSQMVDQGGKKPCDKEGFAGNWILRLNSGYLPKILNADGTQELAEKDMVKTGDYVQVLADVKSNGNVQKPGVYLNHKAVAFIGYGERIVYEADYSGVGFGTGVVPAGASQVPPAGNFSAQAAIPAVPGVPASMPAAPVAAPVAPAPMAVPAPNPAILAAPAPVAPAVPAVPAAPAPVAVMAKVMTDKAGGLTYDQMKSQGWTDELLVQHGYMGA